MNYGGWLWGDHLSRMGIVLIKTQLRGGGSVNAGRMYDVI